jgi:hypothetical protein
MEIKYTCTPTLPWSSLIGQAQDYPSFSSLTLSQYAKDTMWRQQKKQRKNVAPVCENKHIIYTQCALFTTTRHTKGYEKDDTIYIAIPYFRSLTYYLADQLKKRLCTGLNSRCTGFKNWCTKAKGATRGCDCCRRSCCGTNGHRFFPEPQHGGGRL